MKNEALFYSIINWIQCSKSPPLWNGGGTPIYTKTYDNNLINVDPLFSPLTHIFLNQ